MIPDGDLAGRPVPSPGLLAGLAERWGELTPYRVAGAGATYLCGEALVYLVPPLSSGPPWEYLAHVETLDDLLQADGTFVVFVGAGPDDLWTVPAEEVAFLIEGREPQTGPEGERAWRFHLTRRDGSLDPAGDQRWLLRAESNPREEVDLTGFHNATPGG